MVLLQLPMRDLLLAQRACKWIKGVITESPSLQRALFFEPVYALPAEDFRCGKHCCTEHALLPGDFLVCNSKLRVYGNPIFRWIFDDVDDDCDRLRGEDMVLPPAFAYRKASWRRMLVTQPPLPRVTIEWPLDMRSSVGGGRDSGCQFRDIREKGGVRLETLWSWVKALRRDPTYCAGQEIMIRGLDGWREWQGQRSLQELTAEASRRRT